MGRNHGVMHNIMTIIMFSIPLQVNATFCCVKYHPAPKFSFHRTEKYKYQWCFLSAQPTGTLLPQISFLSVDTECQLPFYCLVSVSWILQQFYTIFCCNLLALAQLVTSSFFSRSFTKMPNTLSPDTEPSQSPMAVHLPWKHLFSASCHLLTNYSTITLLGPA